MLGADFSLFYRKKFGLSLLLLFLLNCSLICILATSDVLEFNDENFRTKIKEYEIILVEFYTPWCGHCKKLAPEYELAATKLKKNDPPIPLAKVDCTTNKETCDSLGVGGFPTLKIFRKGEPIPYDGPREADGIYKLMRSQVGPSSKELKNEADYEKFIDSDEHSVVGFFDKETKLKDSFLKVADTERDRYRFAHTTDKKLCETFDLLDDIVIVQPKHLHSKFEDSQARYDGNYDTEKIKKFLATHMNGLCGHRTSENAYTFDRPLIVVYYKVDYIKDTKGTNYWRNRILKVAKEYRRKITFAISNKDDFSMELDAYGLANKKDLADKPLVAAQGTYGEKYFMDEEFSVENLKKFADDLLAGKLKNYMKSESLPESNDQPVKVLVANNFKSIVDGKDALIDIYAPWCGHCKQLDPIFEKLGDKMIDEDVVIAKLDGTANDLPPGYSANGYPTIYWKPKNGTPMLYQGGRDLKAFVDFLARESSNELKGWSRDGKRRKAKLEL